MFYRLSLRFDLLGIVSCADQIYIWLKYFKQLVVYTTMENNYFNLNPMPALAEHGLAFPIGYPIEEFG